MEWHNSAFWRLVLKKKIGPPSQLLERVKVAFETPAWEWEPERAGAKGRGEKE